MFYVHLISVYCLTRCVMLFSAVHSKSFLVLANLHRFCVYVYIYIYLYIIYTKKMYT